MNRKIFFTIITGILVLGSGYAYLNKSNVSAKSESQALWKDYKVIEKNIEGKQYKLVVADNPERWQKGLMFVRKPTTQFDGMIFIFPSYEYKTFWNLNTYEDLTLYWMKDDVVTSKSPLPSIEKSKDIVRVSSTEPVNIVVELID